MRKFFGVALAALFMGGSIVSAFSATSLSTWRAGIPTQASVSVANTSTKVLDASAATSFVKLCVAATAANGIWVRWDGGTATAAAPAEYIPPGQCDSWTQGTGFLPISQINAIASATVAVSLIYN